MLNYIWLSLIVLSVILGGFAGRLDKVTAGAFESAKDAVMVIALPLAGIMALWLGMMRLAELAGLVHVLARWIRPVTRRLFPDVPADHPAMGSMLMNIAANMLGLNNAATPLGLRAMRDLETLNPRPGEATNAMCTFLAINTSSVTLIPVTAIGILAAFGSRNPTAIVGTAFLATVCSTVAGLTAVKLLEKLPRYAQSPVEMPARQRPDDRAEVVGEPVAIPAMTRDGTFVLALYFTVFVLFLTLFSFQETSTRMLLAAHEALPNLVPVLRPPSLPPDLAGQGPFTRTVGIVSLLSVPFMLSFLPLYAALRRVKVYEEFVEGAKEGIQVALRIIPFLVAIIVAVKMFREAGGIDMLSAAVAPVLRWVGFPSELLPMVLVRPLSGGATTGIFTELVKTHGADSMISRMAATIFGSTETTFYVIAVYFGSVSVRRTRHAVPAGLIADLTGVVASVVICRAVF